uniref:Opioid growth factor receptor (OGFr) conserved domain-containing protein n=1 Tax=Leptobrachium leishanense TaxID=445787 RepID=A0A8C5MFS0_9ANUR
MCENPRVHLDLIATLNPATLLPDCEEDPNHECLQVMEEKGHNEILKGNRRADQAAKAAAKPLVPPDQVSKVLLCKQDDEDPMLNYEFYMNWRKFEPKGEFIDIILRKWVADDELLEDNHFYIQWLFPNQGQANIYIFVHNTLSPKEARLMINTSEIQQRLRRAYKMMLKFFGVKLVGEDGEDTGVTEIERAENFAERFDNLTANPHNNLRITRMLLSLGELGAEEYQAPLVKFFLRETLIENNLPQMKKSVMNFFVPAVRHVQKRRDLLYFAWRHYQPREEFIWGKQEEFERYKVVPWIHHSRLKTAAANPEPEWNGWWLVTG